MTDRTEIPGFTIEDRRFALPILQSRFPEALQDFQHVLGEFRISASEIIGGGGGEAKHTQRLRKALASRLWLKKNISTTQTVVVQNAVKHAAEPGTEYELPSESHEVDHVRTFDAGTIALEIEWNNKDPFFDRDLENFRRLHHIGLVSVGIIITRGPGLQDHLRKLFLDHYGDTARYRALDDVECTEAQKRDIKKRIDHGTTLGAAAAHVLFANKYGTATTHWDKLIERVDGRLLGNPCPLVLIGIEATRVGGPDIAEPVQSDLL